MYDYRTLTIGRGEWPRVMETVSARPDFYALFRGQIGFASDEGVLVTTGPDEIPGVAAASSVRLEPTVRPSEARPPIRDGIYAHRWFHVAEGDVPEFLYLSQQGWVTFERDYDAQVLGLWRRTDPAPLVHLLLITRYASLAEWERSREGTGAFARRAALTRWTIVRTTRLARRAS